MRVPIKKNSQITLSSNGQKHSFTINDILGIGGSCIAYQVSYYENGSILRRGILKEFCPTYLVENGDFFRNNGCIKVLPQYAKRFQEGLQEFKNVYKNINNYISQNAPASNYHTVQMGLFEGNNTAYTLSSLDYGQSYDKLKDNSLQSILKIALATAKAVELYHKAGYLHLDIKPKNILVLDGVKDIIKLFDYDSLTSIKSIKDRSVFSIPVPEDYYVPELSNAEVRNIGIYTDVFEIGAMIFSKIFERTPVSSDISYDAKFDFDVPMLNGVSPKAKYEFEQLFKNTLQISKRRRYQTDEQLIAQLKKLISLLESKSPYLINLPLWHPSSFCVERTNDLARINARLMNDGYVFVSGMGGMGKSELAKIYAQKYQNIYHTIQFCKFTSSMKNTVAAMPVDGINDNDYKNIDELAKAKNKVLHTCDSKTLIIIDNFNITYDEFLREFLPSNENGFKVIFTTRCIPASDYYKDKVYHLGHLSFDDCARLFYSHSKIERSFENDIQLEKLCELIDYNILILVLLSKSVNNTSLSISQLYNILEEQKLDNINTEIFHEYDISYDEIKAYNKIAAHMNVIFDVNNLSDIEIKVLKNMTLVPSIGIDIDEFIKNCKSTDITKDIIYILISQSWLEFKTENCITLHSIVSDIIAGKITERDDSYYSLAEYMESFYNVNEASHISVLLKGLACALQLDKRYKSESIGYQAAHKYAMAGLYMALYKPKEVKDCIDNIFVLLKESDEEETSFLAYIYSLLGEYESRYGTLDASNKAYNKAIEYYSKAELEGDLFIFDTLCSIADNYEENNEIELAYQKYQEIFDMARESKNIMFLRVSIEKMCSLSKNLGYEDKELYYKGLRDKLNHGSDNEEDVLDKIEKYTQNGDFDKTLESYEEYLSELREELGEDSPLYKYASGARVVCYFTSGKREEAIRMLSEYFNFLEETFGKKSMELANQIVHTVPFVIDCYEIEYATNMVNRAIKICKHNKQLNSYTYTKAKLDLLTIYTTLGNKDKAYELVDEINFDRFSGAEVLSDVIRSVGIVLCDLSRFDKTKMLCNKLLDNKGTSNYDRFFAYIILSICYEQKGFLDEAQHYSDCAGQELDVEKIKKFNSIWFFIYKRSIARLKMRLGDNEGALSESKMIFEAFDDDMSPMLYIIYVEQIVYYTNLNMYDNAIECIIKAETILKNNKLQGGSYLTLYNNAAYCYINMGDYKNSQKYLDKILKIRPQIIKADNFDSAIICGNIGWNEFNLGENKSAEKFLKIAIMGFERLGSINANEYYIVKYNLALLYSSQQNFVDAYEICRFLYGNEDKVLNTTEQQVKTYIRLTIVQGLLSKERAEEAYEFAVNEDKLYSEFYGDCSVEKLDLLQKFFTTFRMFGYIDCWDFCTAAQKIVNNGDFDDTIHFARQLNLNGVYEVDENNNPYKAEPLFKQSKALFEALDATDDEYYPIVLQNIEYTDNEIIKRLFD